MRIKASHLPGKLKVKAVSGSEEVLRNAKVSQVNSQLELQEIDGRTIKTHKSQKRGDRGGGISSNQGRCREVES